MVNTGNESVADMLENLSKSASSAINGPLVVGRTFQQVFAKENISAVGSILETTQKMLNTFSSINELHLTDAGSSLIEMLGTAKSIQLGPAITEFVKPAIDQKLNWTGILSVLCENTPKVDISVFESGISPAVKEALLAVDSARPLLDESERSSQDLVTPPEIQPKKSKWSRSEIMSLLMTILTIITLLKSCADSAEQEVVQEQNQIIITQNQTMIEQNERSIQQRQEIIDRLETAALALAEELDEQDNVNNDAEDGFEISHDTNQADVLHDDVNKGN